MEADTGSLKDSKDAVKMVEATVQLKSEAAHENGRTKTASLVVTV